MPWAGLITFGTDNGAVGRADNIRDRQLYRGQGLQHSGQTTVPWAGLTTFGTDIGTVGRDDNIRDRQRYRGQH